MDNFFLLLTHLDLSAFKLLQTQPSCCDSFCGSLSSLETERRVVTSANAACLTNYWYVFTHNMLEVTCWHRACHFMQQTLRISKKTSYNSENNSSPEISVDSMQLIVGTFSNLSLDSFLKIEQYIYGVSQKSFPFFNNYKTRGGSKVFHKYLRDTWCFLNELLANLKIRTDTLKNILKFLKSC